MAWELVAIWLIVAATFIWFIRDEKRVQSRKLAERARFFATDTAFRHHGPLRAEAGLRPREQGLTELQRKFIEELRRQRSAG